MKLKTRLIITFIVIVMVPEFLIFLTFLMMSNAVIANTEEGLMLLSQIPSRTIISMASAIFIILVGTALALVFWIYWGVFHPVDELNDAMQNIADGNLEFQLSKDIHTTGEIAELGENYELMRLRLKESTEEKLLREEQTREMITNISHDLKTPMTTIKGYAEALCDGVAATPEKQQKYLRTILTKTEAMDKLVNELFVYASIDNGQITYNFMKIDVDEFFTGAMQGRYELEEKGIKLKYSYNAEAGAQIIADPQQLKRVVDNIIGNSVKYMDKTDAFIDVRIQDLNSQIQIDIEDNGCGIASTDLPRVFERFYRTDASRNSLRGGSGIGLSIVKRIVEDHGGVIWATSTLGEGTCMHLVFRRV